MDENCYGLRKAEFAYTTLDKSPVGHPKSPRLRKEVWDFWLLTLGLLVSTHREHIGLN